MAARRPGRRGGHAPSRLRTVTVAMLGALWLWAIDARAGSP